MKITTNYGAGLGPMSPTQGATARTESGFSVEKSQTADRTQSIRAMAQASGVFGMDAILAMQGEEDPMTGRRRRQVHRANGLLDELDKIKIALLEGQMDTNLLLMLKARLDEKREEVDDEALGAMLNEVETRALVELAKRKMV